MTITPSTDNARADWDENVSQMSETPGNHDSPSRHPVVLHARVVTGEGGGPEKTILNSPRFLTKLGYDAYCAYLREPRDAGFAQIAARAKELAAPLIEIDDRGPLDLRVATQLLRICRRHKVAIWHGHDYKSNALGVLLKRFHRMKLVTTVHGWVKFTRRTPLYYGIDRLALRFYDRVVAVSEDLRQRCLATGVRENRCVTIKNAIDAQQYLRQHSRSDAKERLQFPQARFLVGAAGRLSEEKGFSLLIQAVDRLIRAGHDLGLVIAGEGDEREQLTSLIARLGQSERVRLLGYRADMLPFYEALDCFALSSLREGLPNVALEAMAMGTPVIATSVAGVPDLIQTGENGWQVAPGNELELAAALETLARDASLREKLGQAGQATILRDYSFERRMERMAEVYQQVLGPAGKETRV